MAGRDGVRAALVALCLGFVFGLAGCGPGGFGAQAEAEQGLVADGQVHVLVPDAQSRDRLIAKGTAAGYRLAGAPKELRALGLIMVAFALPEGVTGAQAIAALEALEPSAVAGVNHAYTLQQSATRSAGAGYADALMDWPVGGCRAQVPIGVIDTAVDAGAPALRGTRLRAKRFASGAALDRRHGTEVASILAGDTRLRGVTLFSADVIEGTPSGSGVAGAVAMVEALDWLAERRVRLVTLALAGPYNKLLDLAVERAHGRGLVIVAAVGNAGPGAEPMYPAAFEEVLAVTAVDARRGLYRDAVRGAHVDVAAPGVDVRVETGAGARFVSGTSIAAPFVAARIAADPAARGGLDVRAVRRRLAATSLDLGAAGRDAQFGVGLAQATGVCSGGRGS